MAGHSVSRQTVGRAVGDFAACAVEFLRQSIARQRGDAFYPVRAPHSLGAKLSFSEGGRAIVELPKNFDDRTWWILLGIVGGLVAAGSAPAKFIPGLMIGLGLALFAVGQWQDRPIQTSRTAGVTTTKYLWQPSVLGICFDVVGILLFLGGIGWLVAFGP